MTPWRTLIRYLLPENLAATVIYITFALAKTQAGLAQCGGSFQSGQMGQTVNLLLLASVVRIHHYPHRRYRHTDYVISTIKQGLETIMVASPFAFCTSCCSPIFPFMMPLIRLPPAVLVVLKPPHCTHQRSLSVGYQRVVRLRRTGISPKLQKFKTSKLQKITV